MRSCSEEADLDRKWSITYQPSLAHRQDFPTEEPIVPILRLFCGALTPARRIVKPLLSERNEGATAGTGQFFYRGSVRAVDRWIANGPIEAVTDGGLVRGGSVPARAEMG
jgi:hypothetical protein